MKDTRVHGCRLAQDSYKTAPELLSAKPTFVTDVSTFCAVEIGLVLQYVSSVECKPMFFCIRFYCFQSCG